MIRLTIFGEPASKANSRKLVTFGRGESKRPGFIKSEKARNYEREAARQIPDAARLMLTGPVRVTLRVFYASERPDLDESVILDVLQAKYKKVKGRLHEVGEDEFGYGPSERQLMVPGVYINDRQVREKHVFHAIDRNNPRAEIEIEQINPQLFESAPIVRKERAMHASGHPF